MNDAGFESPEGAVTRTIWRLTSATARGEPVGTSSCWTVRTPPVGSESLASRSTSTCPPSGRTPRSSSVLGGRSEPVGATSTRMMPVAVVGPSVIVYDR